MRETILPPEQEQQETESEKKYNFERMAEFERCMIPLIEQLKSRIEMGEYGTLLSDEVGGRIPTLVLRGIIKEKGALDKRKQRQKVETKFLAGGRDMPTKSDPEKYKELKDHLKRLKIPKTEKLLVVSQLISSGGTFKRIGEALNDPEVGIHSFDYAAVNSVTESLDTLDIKEDLKKRFNSELFVGVEGDQSEIFFEGHEDLSGVTKSSGKNHNPSSEKIRNFNFKKSREDIKLMVKRIIEKVWPEENK